MPKYCKECCLQGHYETNCWTIHPKILEQKHIEDHKKEEQTGSAETKEKCWQVGWYIEIFRIKWNRWKEGRTITKKDKYGHIEGEINSRYKNPFNVLRDVEDREDKMNEYSTERVKKMSMELSKWIPQRIG